MKKFILALLLVSAIGTATALMLPRISVYREWRTNAEVRISESTRMEIQDSWIVQSPDRPRLFRIRAAWHGKIPFEQQLVSASLTNKTGEAVYSKKWYVPLASGPDSEEGNLFMWEFELPAGKKLDHDLILEVNIHPDKNYASIPSVSKCPLHFFGTETPSFAVFPFRAGS